MQTNYVTAAFMSAGLHASYAKTDAILAHWGAGHIELVDALMSYMPYAVALMTAGHAVTGEFPGVPDYEISEVFGAWFGTEIMTTTGAGVLPAPKSCYGELRRLAFQFFNRDENPDNINETLAVALIDVPEQAVGQPE
jgi:hypothetical protein